MLQTRIFHDDAYDGRLYFCAKMIKNAANGARIGIEWVREHALQ
jgi:hypothetical protein